MEYEAVEEDDLSVAVVEAVSAHEDRRALALPPLCDAVDPDALDNLFPTTEGGETRRTGLLSFEYSDSHVTVDPNDGITVVELPRSEVRVVE